MSERRPRSLSVTEEIHALRRDVTEKLTAWESRLLAWEAQLAGWDRVISETLTDALEQGEAKAAERWQTEAQKLERTRALWGEREQTQFNRLSDAAERAESLTGDLTDLTKRLEHLHEPWFLKWSRDRWQGLVVTVLVTLLVTTLYLWLGPQAQERAKLEADLALYRRAWNALTETEQKRVEKRLQEQSAAQ